MSRIAPRGLAHAFAALLPRTVAGTLAAVALVIAGPIALLEVGRYAVNLEDHRRLEQRVALELARATAVSVEAFVHHIESDLLTLGDALSLPSAQAADAPRLLAQAAAEHPGVAVFSWYGPDGTWLASGKTDGATPALPRAILAAAIRKGAVLTDLVATEEGPAFFMARAIPAPRGGVRGIMTATILESGVARTALPSERAGGGAVAVTDASGRIVCRQPEMKLGWDERNLLAPGWGGEAVVAQAIAGAEVTGTLTSLTDGRLRLAGAAPVGRTGWAAVVTRREDLALAGVRHELRVRAAVFASLLGAALLAAFALGRRISVPILELARNAGGEGHPHRARSVPRELRVLSAALVRQRRQIVVRERRLARARADAERAADRSQREAALLDSMLESAPHAIVLYDQDGTIARMNAEATALLGYVGSERRLPPDRRSGVGRLRTAAGEPLPWSDTPMQRALAGEVVRSVELRLEPKGGAGRPAWTSVSAAPVRGAGGEVVHAVAMFVDVTEVKELQEQRDDLLRVVSHDLRSPLSAMLHQAQLVLHRPGEPAWVAARARAIVVAAGRMNAMIQDLLDAARFERGQLTLSLVTVDLRRFVSELLERLEGTLAVARIRVRCGGEDVPAVRADPNRLERIVVNLLSNALKYSDAEVELAVGRQGDEALISVADHGPGIDPADLPGLFDRFSRTAKGRAQGVGLGLYSTRVLVEAHGGRLSVASEPGRGATFSVALPVAPAP